MYVHFDNSYCKISLCRGEAFCHCTNAIKMYATVAGLLIDMEGI